MLLNLLSRRLQLPVKYLRKTAKQASHLYKTYTIKKRDGVSLRTIHHPARQLKAIQREITAAILADLPVHQAATAYRIGVSIKANAELHAHNRFLMRLDIADFFPSLRRAHLQLYIQRNAARFPGWNKEDIDLLCDFTCRNDKLTIGAPTSPVWCNALCFYLDLAIAEYSASRGITYSRYADDLYFSSRETGVLWSAQSDLVSLVESIDLPAGLKVNKSKTAHASLKRRRKVTGLVLANDGKVSIGRDNKRRVRGLMYRLDTLTAEERNSLAGYLGFCADIEPQFVNRLVLKYGSALVERALRP